jgi:Xaa-Pro aminopeptidase
MLARMDLSALQTFLRDHQIDAWLVYDFRGCNPILAQLLPGQRWTTRRAMLVIPADGDASVIVHNIDAPQFATCGLARRVYDNWQQWQQFVREATSGNSIAMEYSPLGELPAVSFVDGGTLEFIRSLGATVVSSEDAIQFAVARWSPEALAKHHHASKLTAAVKDDAFKLIRDRLVANQPVTERDVEQHILKRFADHGLDPDHPPIVGVNEHSGDPHFEVSATNPSPIRRGDWVLIDLWSRLPGNENVFADITWMAFCGPKVPDEHRRVWEAVKAARDAAYAKVVDAWKTKTPMHGWELDEAAQAAIRAHGLSQFIRHRTGHSLSPGPKIHGLGANLDNFETRDTRLILPGTGFTIEPALYTPAFGCRSEINVFVDPDRGPMLTSPMQDDVTLLS